MCRRLTGVASFVAEHSFEGTQAPVFAVLSSYGSWALQYRLNSGARAQLLRDTRDLPRPGIELVSPALAGGFFTNEPLRMGLEVFKRSPGVSVRVNGRSRTTQPCAIHACLQVGSSRYAVMCAYV